MAEKDKNDDSDSAEKYEDKTVQDYRRQINLINKKIRDYNKTIRDKNEIIRELNDDNEKRGLHIIKLDAEIALLRDEIEEKNLEIIRLSPSRRKKKINFLKGKR